MSDPGDMPAEMPDLGGLLDQAMAMQQEMADAQARLAATEVEGQAGGGVVRVVMTGDFDVRAVHLSPEVIDPDEAEMLGDLVQAAFRHAISQVADAQAQAMASPLPDVGQLLEGLGGLPGLGLPGGDEDPNRP